MVRGDERDPAPAVHLPAKFAEALPRAEEGGRRRGPERHEHLRPDQLDLPAEVGEAGLLLLGERRPVLRRPALHHVGDEDPLPGNLYRRKDGVQQVACRPDERASGRVLGLPGPFPDEHQPGGRVALARHRVGAPLAERALAAGCHDSRDRLQRVEGRPVVHQAPRGRLVHQAVTGDRGEVLEPPRDRNIRCRVPGARCRGGARCLVPRPGRQPVTRDSRLETAVGVRMGLRPVRVEVRVVAVFLRRVEM